LSKVTLVSVDATQKHDLEEYDHHPAKYGDIFEEVCSTIEAARSV